MNKCSGVHCIAIKVVFVSKRICVLRLHLSKHWCTVPLSVSHEGLIEVHWSFKLISHKSIHEYHHVLPLEGRKQVVVAAEDGSNAAVLVQVKEFLHLEREHWAGAEVSSRVYRIVNHDEFVL